MARLLDWTVDGHRIVESVGFVDSRGGLRLLKEWREELHPRGRDGRFINKHTIEEAAKSVEDAKALYAVVRPQDRDSLSSSLKRAGMAEESIREASSVNSESESRPNIAGYQVPTNVESMPANDLADAVAEALALDWIAKNGGVVYDAAERDALEASLLKLERAVGANPLAESEEYRSQVEGKQREKVVALLGGVEAIKRGAKDAFVNLLDKSLRGSQGESQRWQVANQWLEKLRLTTNDTWDEVGNVLAESVEEITANARANPSAFPDKKLLIVSKNLEMMGRHLYGKEVKATADRAKQKVDNLIEARVAQAELKTKDLTFEEARSLAFESHERGDVLLTNSCKNRQQVLIEDHIQKNPIRLGSDDGLSFVNEFRKVKSSFRDGLQKLASQTGIPMVIGEDGVERQDGGWEKIAGQLKAKVAAEVGGKLPDIGNNHAYEKFLDQWGVTDRETPVKESTANAVIKTWSTTSGDHNPFAIAVQHAVASRFGIDRSVAYKASMYDDGKSPDTEAAEIYSNHKEVLDAVVDTMYQHTQDRLRESGIEQLALMRGMSLGEEDVVSGQRDIADTVLAAKRIAASAKSLGLSRGSAEVTIDSNPISSFTTSADTAYTFAAGYGTGNLPTMVLEVVPRERIFATPFTGMGCLAEHEIVVLGGERKSKAVVNSVVSVDPIEADNLLKVIERDSASRTVAKASGTEQLAIFYVDAFTPDWPKRTRDDLNLPSVYRKSWVSLRKGGFDPLQPRGDDGRWIRLVDIARAAADQQWADMLRERVTNPEQRKKLESAIQQQIAANPITARNVPTVSRWGEWLTENADQWHLKPRHIEQMIHQYARSTMAEKIKLLESSEYPMDVGRLDVLEYDLEHVGGKTPPRLRLLPSEEEKSDPNLRANIEPEDFVFVAHDTDDRWIQDMMRYGVDTASSPPDTRLGRLSVEGDGSLRQSRIDSHGLYVSAASSESYGLILQIKAGDIGLSMEAKELGYAKGIDGLYLADDALISGVAIPPECVVGYSKYDLATKSRVWVPNPLNPNSGMIRVSPDGHRLEFSSQPTKEKEPSQVNKAGFNPLQPRGDDGRWIRIGDIIAAAGNPLFADQLRQRISDPVERQKFDAMLAQVEPVTRVDPDSNIQPSLPGMEDAIQEGFGDAEKPEVLARLRDQWKAASIELDAIAEEIDGETVEIELSPTVEELATAPDDFLVEKIDEFFEDNSEVDEEIEQMRNEYVEEHSGLDELLTNFIDENREGLSLSDDQANFVLQELNGKFFSGDQDIDPVAVIADILSSDSASEELADWAITDEDDRAMKREFRSQVDLVKESTYEEFDIDEATRTVREKFYDASIEYAMDAWSTLPTEEKIEALGLANTKEVLLELDQAGPGGKKTEEQEWFENNHAIAQEMYSRRVQQLFDKHQVKEAPESVKERMQEYFQAWIGSSSSFGAKAMMRLAVDELGAHERKDFELPGMDRITSDGGESLSVPEKNEVGKALKLAVRAKWEVSQWLMEKSGTDEVILYRGLTLPDAQVGDTEEVDSGKQVYKKYPNARLLKSTLQSATPSRLVASGFGTHVIRMAIPREMVLAVPAMGKNEHEEEEYIVLGGHWPKWDLWHKNAPPEEEVTFAN